MTTYFQAPDVQITFGPVRARPAVSATPRIRFDGCPLCTSRSISRLRTADCSTHTLYQACVEPLMTWMCCEDCSHVFTDGYFSPEVAQAIFERTQDNQRPGADFEHQRTVSAKMVESVARFAATGAWLDVGFGNGSLLFTADEWGFTPVGLDLRPSSVAAMQRLGIEAYCADAASFDQRGRFSVVSMADVLEHMPFPRDGLAAAKRLLRPGGVLFASMPNYNCMAWRLLDATNSNPYWGELEHYHNFSRARLQALLRDAGFEPVHYSVSDRYRVCMETIAKSAD